LLGQLPEVEGDRDEPVDLDGVGNERQFQGNTLEAKVEFSPLVRHRAHPVLERVGDFAAGSVRIGHAAPFPPCNRNLSLAPTAQGLFSLLSNSRINSPAVLPSVTNPSPELTPGYSSAKRELLALLKRRPGASLGEIAQEVELSKAAVLGHLAPLESAGLVERAYR